jgi:18S rRNA (guanine1575-N7)-methyltransferase
LALLPEDFIVPEIYYTEDRAKQYEKNSRIQKIQKEMTYRALELIKISPPALILDIGCGTGISMQVLKTEGYEVKGVDIAEPMLMIARAKGLDVLRADFTVEIPFEPGFFDCIISISTLQWIFHGFKPSEIYEKIRRTTKEIKRVLKADGKAIFQFYPKNDKQLDLAGRIFKNEDFKVVKIIDNPNIPKRRKVYLLCRKTI